MNLTTLSPAGSRGPNPIIPSRTPLPILGVASWTCIAFGELGCQLILLWNSRESLGLAGGAFMLPFVMGGLGGALGAALLSLRRRERPRVIAWASLGLVTLLVGGFILAMVVGIVQEALGVWHTR